jgi:hypothetical protein
MIHRIEIQFSVDCVVVVQFVELALSVYFYSTKSTEGMLRALQRQCLFQRAHHLHYSCQPTALSASYTGRN